MPPFPSAGPRKQTPISGLEVVERILDEGVRQIGDDVGGELRADGFQQQVSLFVERGEVRVVDVLGGGKQGGTIGRIERPEQFIHRVVFLLIRHGRRLAGENAAGKENEGRAGA